MSSFFSKVLGKKETVSSPSPAVSASLADFSGEELIGAAPQTVDRAAAAVVAETKEETQTRVFAVLEAMERWAQLERHRNDHERKFTQLWSALLAFDWARSPRGFCCDANKSVKVGLGEYSRFEDAPGTQIVIIMHFDSERPGNYQKRNSWGEVPPVWAVAFSCAELKELTQKVVENAATEGTLIHREPQGEDFDYATEPWFNESHWLVENNKITGVRLRAKCTQDATAHEHIVRFKTRGDVFELVEVVKNPAAVSAVAVLERALPAPCEPILPPAAAATPAAETKESAEAQEVPEGGEGESVLTLRVCRGQTAARNYNDRENGLCQTLQTPVLALTNPTDTRLAITEFWVEFLQQEEEKEEWVRAPTRLGVESSSSWGGHSTHFLDWQTIEVEAHSSVEILLEGTWTKSETDAPWPAYNGRPHNQRIHACFPAPLRARAVFKDESGATKSFSFSHANEPLDDVWSTYEEAVESSGEKGLQDSFGADFQCEMWLCVENPLDLNKCIICVATKKTEPHDWFVRVQYDRRDIGSSYNQVGPTYFRKMAFKASLKEKDRPAEIDVDLGGNQYCTLTGLIDYETKTIYALHGKIRIEHNGKVIAQVEDYAKLDYSRVTQETS